MKKIFSLFMTIGFVFCFVSISWADLTFINLDDSGSPVTVDIGVDATTAAAGGIAGAAFTLKHSSELTVNVSSTFFETFTTQGFDTSDGLDAQGEVDGYASPLISNTITSPYSGTRIAAARFEEKAISVGDALFSLSITSASTGTYAIEIVATKLSNTDAGYDSIGETIDLLIGADETVSDPTDPNAFPKILQRNADENYVFASESITFISAGKTITYTFQPGYNLIPFSLSDTGIVKASDLDEAVVNANSGVKVSQIFGWDAANQRFTSPYANLPFGTAGDFDLSPGQAYFVQTDGSASLTLSGSDYSSLSLSDGYNAIAVPAGKSSSIVMASDFDSDIEADSGVSVSQIFGWDAVNQRFSSPYADLPFGTAGDFNLSWQTNGYFIQISGNGTYSP